MTLLIQPPSGGMRWRVWASVHDTHEAAVLVDDRMALEDMDGILGMGDTRDEAVADAIATLGAAVLALKQAVWVAPSKEAATDGPCTCAIDAHDFACPVHQQPRAE